MGARSIAHTLDIHYEGLKSETPMDVKNSVPWNVGTGLSMDERNRCGWGSIDVDPVMRAYHDHEWGVPTHDDRKQFEFLLLEGAQAGLSWSTILHRRAGYARAFRQFDPKKVARFDAKRIAQLMHDHGIIRNRLKIRSAVRNARAFLAVQDEFGSFDTYAWRFVKGKPRQNRWKALRDIPPASKQSDAFSHDLKQRGFTFVGSTIMYAHMQAVGMVNDHVVDCYRHRELARLAQRSSARAAR